MGDLKNARLFAKRRVTVSVYACVRERGREREREREGEREGERESKTVRKKERGNSVSTTLEISLSFEMVLLLDHALSHLNPALPQFNQ